MMKAKQGKKLARLFAFISTITVVGIIMIFAWTLNFQDSNFNYTETENEAILNKNECISCHESFYKNWHNSLHGQSISPITYDFLVENINWSDSVFFIGGNEYMPVFSRKALYIQENYGRGLKLIKSIHAIGGKHYYMFTCFSDEGDLNILPIGYNVHTDQFIELRTLKSYHLAALFNEVRPHNTYKLDESCIHCHLDDFEADIRSTVAFSSQWNEPGISCASCHGDEQEHLRRVETQNSKLEGNSKGDWGIRTFKNAAPHEINTLCLKCHNTHIDDLYPKNDTVLILDHSDIINFERANNISNTIIHFNASEWSKIPCVSSHAMSCIDCHDKNGKLSFNKSELIKACNKCH